MEKDYAITILSHSNNNRAQCWAIGSAISGSQESTGKGENSRMQSVCDEDTHRIDCNYKETRIKKRCFLLFLGRCPQSSPRLASNYTVWLVSVLTLNWRRKRRDMLAPNEKREIFLSSYRSQQDAIKAQGVFSVFPICILPPSRFLPIKSSTPAWLILHLWEVKIALQNTVTANMKVKLWGVQVNIHNLYLKNTFLKIKLPAFLKDWVIHF